MKEIFIFTLIGYGISNILIYSSLFEPWRKFLAWFGKGDLSIHKLFSCMMCLPTWIGFGLSTLFYYLGVHSITPVGQLGIENIYLHIFLDGVFLSGCVWLIHTLQEYFEK